MWSLWWTSMMVLVTSQLFNVTVAKKVKHVDYSGHKVIRVFPKTAQQAEVVRKLENVDGVDVWGEMSDSTNRSASAVDLHVTPQVYDEVTSRLQRSNVQFVVGINNLQSAIDDHRADTIKHRTIVRRRRAALTDDDTGGIVGVYASHNEINNWLRTLERRHSDIVQLIEIGRSYEERSLVVIKIGKESQSSKPAIWIDAGIHAREWIAPATAVYIIHALISGNGKDKLTTKLVANYDWYILPVDNPDGYEYTKTTDRLWRKTRRPVTRDCVGVDGNRNFDFHWLSECKGKQDCPGKSPCKNVFAGKRPFSEPETVAISDFIMKHRSSIRLYLSLHNYGKLFLMPWAYTKKPPADHDDLLRVANRAVNALQSVHNTAYRIGSPAVILYVSTGTSYDWAKGVAGIKYSYIMELRDGESLGFLLPSSQIIPTGEETWAGIQAAVEEMALDECWVTGKNCP